MFSQTVGRPGGEDEDDIVLAVASLSLLCPFECTFQKSYLGLGTLGFGLLGLPLRQMQQVYEADDDGGWGRGMPETLHCQFMHVCVCVFVCALKLLQNGRRNGGKIAAK